MSGLGTYDETLFSVHMVQHMMLSMVAPVFLALGAPVTLALRTLPPRGRGAVLALLHSRLARVLTFPPVGWLLFVGSPFALYFTGWYPATLEHSWLHQLLHLHFLLVGCLFFWPLIGPDPLPGRLPYPARFLLVFAALPMHAILGLSIMNMRELIAADHYAGLGLTWVDPLSDQRVGAACCGRPGPGGPADDRRGGGAVDAGVGPGGGPATAGWTGERARSRRGRHGGRPAAAGVVGEPPEGAEDGRNDPPPQREPT